MIASETFLTFQYQISRVKRSIRSKTQNYVVQPTRRQLRLVREEVRAQGPDSIEKIISSQNSSHFQAKTLGKIALRTFGNIRSWFRHVSESELNLNPFLKPKSSQNCFNWIRPQDGRVNVLILVSSIEAAVHVTVVKVLHYSTEEVACSDTCYSATVHAV